MSLDKPGGAGSSLRLEDVSSPGAWLLAVALPGVVVGGIWSDPSCAHQASQQP